MGLGISPISFADSSYRIEPIYTVPVQPIHRVEPHSVPTAPVEQVSEVDSPFEDILEEVMKKYENQTHVEIPTSNPYEKSLNAFETRAIVGMNFDMSA